MHTATMHWPFIRNQTYNRRADIHAKFGGQQQSGIVTPREHPAIFIFTGHGASKIGYGDQWLPDGSLRYTGEGQIGDMQMSHGNLAIRDHVLNGKDLLVFEKGVSRGPVEFLGQFYCAGWDYEIQTDVEGTPRNAIVFTLTPAEMIVENDVSISGDDQVNVSLSDLRKSAFAAANPAAAKQGTSATFYVRSAAVRRYVLARAAGICEGCEKAAPFITVGGTPFLEAHHIKRLSDGGPDDPRHMAGICPNCHREAHLGGQRAALNQALDSKIRAKEALLGPI